MKAFFCDDRIVIIKRVVGTYPMENESLDATPEIQNEKYAERFEALRKEVRQILEIEGPCEWLDKAETHDDLRAGVDKIMDDLCRRTEHDEPEDAESGHGATWPELVPNGKAGLIDVNPDLAWERDSGVIAKVCLSDVIDELCSGLFEVLERRKCLKQPVIILYRTFLLEDYSDDLLKQLRHKGVGPVVLPLGNTKIEHQALRSQSLARLRSGSSTIVLATPSQVVERSLTEVIDVEAETPAITPAMLSNLYARVTEERVVIPNEKWVRFLTATDLVVVDLECPGKIGQILKERVMGRRGRSSKGMFTCTLANLWAWIRGTVAHRHN